MIRLCGTPLSNFYNKTKLSLLEMGINFEEVPAMFSQDEATLAKSPMGKVPFLEVDGKFLAESQAIIEYLVETHPSKSLYPKDVWERAKVRELNQILEFYVDPPARELIAPVYFGAPLSEERKTQIWSGMERGVNALKRLVKFSPFIAGDTLTFADCSAFNHLQMAANLSNVIYQKNIIDELPGVGAYIEMMNKRPHCQKVMGDQARAFEEFAAAQK